MKVSELIRKLAELPQDIEVATFDRGDVEWEILERVVVLNGWQTEPDGVIITENRLSKPDNVIDIQFVGL